MGNLGKHFRKESDLTVYFWTSFPAAEVAMLIMFGGLPGTGKTTLVSELARRLSATYLRIDSIEQAVIGSLRLSEAGLAGYFVAYSIAADNLRLRLTVVANSVPLKDIPMTKANRQAIRTAAADR